MEAAERQRFAGVPERYHGLTLSSLEDQAGVLLAQGDPYFSALLRVDEWDFEGMLVLSGPAGCGKSAIMAALCARSEGYPGWMSATAYCDGLRDQSLSVSGVLKRARPFLLDDLGAEYATYFSNQALDALVAQCYEERHPLVITTNLSMAQVGEAYSERMVDRLSESTLWVDMTNGSFRRIHG